MKKNAVKGSLGAIALASVMTMSMGTPVFAEMVQEPEIESKTTTTFDKYLVMDKEAEVPNASFKYTVTAGKARAYDVAGKKSEILAGVDADKVTMAGVGTKTAGTITYKPSDPTLNDKNASVKDYDNSKEKYAKKTATLDFSACKFTEPGIYRYIVTESGTNQAVTNDADATRVVDVYVNDVGQFDRTNLKIAGYVLHSNADDAPEKLQELIKADAPDDYPFPVSMFYMNVALAIANAKSDAEIETELTAVNNGKDSLWKKTKPVLTKAKEIVGK